MFSWLSTDKAVDHLENFMNAIEKEKHVLYPPCTRCIVCNGTIMVVPAAKLCAFCRAQVSIVFVSFFCLFAFVRCMPSAATGLLPTVKKKITSSSRKVFGYAAKIMLKPTETLSDLHS